MEAAKIERIRYIITTWYITLESDSIFFVSIILRSGLRKKRSMFFTIPIEIKPGRIVRVNKVINTPQNRM
jgi:hypothetical protein